jgi:hypothetical protein
VTLSLGVIDKIERSLAVIDEAIAAIDERLMKCGADVAAAQEIQVEKDAKTAKQVRLETLFTN